MKFDDITIPAGQTVTFNDTSKIPVKVMVNGFSIRDEVFTILSANMNANLAESLAEEIEQMFAVKMRLRQA